MSKVMIGVAAAIVLAGAVLAYLHFAHGPSHGPAPTAATTQNGWTVVKDSPRIVDPGLVGKFGSWRLICGDMGPRRMQGSKAPKLPMAPAAGAPVRHCKVAILMRNPASPKGAREWLNLRFQDNPEGTGKILVLAYAHGHAGETFVPLPTRPGDRIDVRADQTTDTMMTDRCVKGICMTIAVLSDSGLDTLVSAHTLVVTLSANKSVKAAEIHIPTAGLKDAFAAMRRQPA